MTGLEEDDEEEEDVLVAVPGPVTNLTLDPDEPDKFSVNCETSKGFF